MQKNELLLTHS
ncbi:TPA: hypothetical protein ROX98_000118 [Bacillus pseudomycoides]|nr:hypothetical protein [Bacillus pseudomycoides]